MIIIQYYTELIKTVEPYKCMFSITLANYRIPWYKGPYTQGPPESSWGIPGLEYIENSVKPDLAQPYTLRSDSPHSPQSSASNASFSMSSPIKTKLNLSNRTPTRPTKLN